MITAILIIVCVNLIVSIALLSSYSDVQEDLEDYVLGKREEHGLPVDFEPEFESKDINFENNEIF